MTEKEAMEILEDLRNAINSNVFGFSKEMAEINEAFEVIFKAVERDMSHIDLSRMRFK